MLRTGLATIFISWSGVGQDGRPHLAQFEVASVKLNNSTNMGLIRVLHGGRFTLIDLPMQEVIKVAYNISKDSQLSKAPAWFTSERYDVDVDARAEGNPSFDVMRIMLQTLLENRMDLKFHYETKQLPIYSLTVAKPGKLREADGDCGTASNSPPDPAKLPNGPCGLLFILPGHILGQKAKLIQLADALSKSTDRVVLDQTNLAARYDIKLEFTPDGPIPPGRRRARFASTPAD